MERDEMTAGAWSEDAGYQLECAKEAYVYV